MLKKILLYLGIMLRKDRYYGFIRGHDYLGNKAMDEIHKLVGMDGNESIVTQYEKEFAKYICDDGYCVSFAAGRMAFFSFLKSANVGSGDEVILTGFTCSVMANAVLRTGATPVYADIESKTYGTNPESIVSKITDKTKVIVAQHSFGIPCSIVEISKIAKQNNILLVEDCAITFDSSVNKQKVGTFGDVAIFSTDHSKPINTIIGGMLFTKNNEIFLSVQSIRDSSCSLSKKRQLDIFKQFVCEKNYQNPDRYILSKFLSFADGFLHRLGLPSRINAFLASDHSELTAHSEYPYPSKLPPFLAAIGILELKRWPDEKIRRKKLLSRMLNLAEQYGYKNLIPASYFDDCLEIIPLRFVFNIDYSKVSKKYITSKIDTDWFWFKSPIICTKRLDRLGYHEGECGMSELLNIDIINIPLVHDDKYSDEILTILENFLILKDGK